MSRSLRRIPRGLILAIALSALLTVLARRRGYHLGLHTVVRCRSGHVFTTIWIPGGSLKAIRLGTARLQHCPVGHHWTLVRPLREVEITDDVRREADEHVDVRIP
jgi:hypothetical protein